MFAKKNIPLICLLLFAVCILCSSSKPLLKESFEVSALQLETQGEAPVPSDRLHCPAPAPVYEKTIGANATASAFSDTQELPLSSTPSRDTYFLQSSPCSPEQLLSFAESRELTIQSVHAALASDDLAQQFQALRLAEELQLHELQSTMIEIVLQEEAELPLRIAACHGLKEQALDGPAIEALLNTASHTKDPLVARGALIALAGSALVPYRAGLEALQADADPFIQMYAWRLWASGEEAPSLDLIKKHLIADDPLLRQECYSALSDYPTEEGQALLTLALSLETDEDLRVWGGCVLESMDLSLEGKEEVLPLLLAEKAYSQHSSEQIWAYEQLKSSPALFDPMKTELIDTLPSEWQEWFLAWYEARHGKPLQKQEALSLQAVEKHNEPVHYEISDYALQVYAGLNNTFPLNEENRKVFLTVNSTEDKGARPITHAYNPLTGRGFLWKHGIGGSAVEYSQKILAQMPDQDGSLLWASAARIFHILQDMTSPNHVYGIWHPFNTSLYENYWTDYQEEVAPLLSATPKELLHPADTAETAEWHLDTFTRSRLLNRIGPLQRHIVDCIESLAWHNCFSTSYWGALSFSSDEQLEEIPALYFSEGATEKSTNALMTAFDGAIEYRSTWYGHYFAARDRKGQDFYWNKCFLLDSFRPCANRWGEKSMDGHGWFGKKKSPTGKTMVAGRFVFLQRGFRAKHCYPSFYPDGTVMTDHLCRYHGAILIPASLRYGLTQLELFNDAFLAKEQSNIEESMKSSPLPYTSDISGATGPGSSASPYRPNLDGAGSSGGRSEPGRLDSYGKLSSFLEALKQGMALFSGGCAAF